MSVTISAFGLRSVGYLEGAVAPLAVFLEISEDIHLIGRAACRRPVKEKTSSLRALGNHRLYGLIEDLLGRRLALSDRPRTHMSFQQAFKDLTHAEKMDFCMS